MQWWVTGGTQRGGEECSSKLNEPPGPEWTPTPWTRHCNSPTTTYWVIQNRAAASQQGATVIFLAGTRTDADRFSKLFHRKTQQQRSHHTSLHSQAPICLQQCGVYRNGDAQRAEKWSSKGREGWESWRGDAPLPTSYGVWGSAVSFPAGVGPGDLECFIGLQTSHFWSQLLLLIYFSEIFVGGPEP